jgi:HPt (histidine-containing phosphotransfer) domain-containing protein
VQLAENLTGALKPVADEMRVISGQVAEVNAKQVELMASAFITQLAGAVHAMSRELAAQMEQAVARFADVPPAIATASDAFRTATDDATNHLRDSHREAAAAYALIAERLRGLATELDQADSRVAARLAALDDGTRDTLAGVRAARDAMAEGATLLTPLRAAAPALDQSASALAAAAQALREAASASDGARGRLSADLGQWHASLDQLDQRLAGVIDRIAPAP